MELKKLHRGAFVVPAVLALSFGLIAANPVSANAEPVGQPIPRAINGSGSDTIQDVLNGVANAAVYNGLKYIGSYNAGLPNTPGQSDTINPLQISGGDFTRPNGSGDGVKALTASINPGGDKLWKGKSITGQLQFARSSSGPAVPGGTDLTYIPFARDAVTVAVSPTRTKVLPSDIPLLNSGINTSVYSDNTLSYQAIFAANNFVTLKHNGVNYTVGAQGSGADIIPFIPQSGSGTRAFFQGKIGGTYGSLVKDQFLSSAGTLVDIQEHNGLVTSVVPNAVVPFSAAQWVAQSNVTNKPVGHETDQNDVAGTLAGITVHDRRYNAVLQAIGGSQPLDAGKQNPNFLPTLTRNVFNVIPTSAITTTSPSEIDLQLRAAFVGPNSAAVATTVIYDGLPTSVIELFGFSRTLVQDISGVTLTPGITGVTKLQSGYSY